MLLDTLGKSLVRTCAIGLVALAFSPALHAEVLPWRCNSCCHRNPTDSVFQSEFFGYHKTCWRPWPGGQPACPVYPTPVVESPEKAAESKTKPAEALPTRKPETLPKK